MSEDSFSENDINLSNLFNMISESWLIIAITMAVGFFLNVIYFHNADIKYTAELRVTPVQRDTGLTDGGLSQLLGEGGITGGSVSFDLYIEGLHSHLAAENLVNNNDIMIKMFPDQWNTEAQEWMDPGSNVIVKYIKKFVGYPDLPWKKPDASSVRGYIRDNVKIDNNIQSPMTIISFEHTDMDLGRQLLENLHQSVEQVLKGRYLEKNREKVEYLTKKMEEATKLDYQQALVATIVEEEQKFIVFMGDEAYAAESFGGVEISSSPTSPKIPLIVISTGLFSFLIGVFIAYFVSVLRMRYQK